MNDASLPDSRLKYWTIHETACWFAGAIPNYEDAENQTLGRSTGSDEVAKIYRLLKDDVLDGTLPCLRVNGPWRNWRLGPRDAIQWANTRGVLLRSELTEMVSAASPAKQQVAPIPATGAMPPKVVEGHNSKAAWTAEARRIADELDQRDAAGGAWSSIADIADRVADDFEKRGILGPRTPLSGGAILRESLGGGKWKRARKRR